MIDAIRIANMYIRNGCTILENGTYSGQRVDFGAPRGITNPSFKDVEIKFVDRRLIVEYSPNRAFTYCAAVEPEIVNDWIPVELNDDESLCSTVQFLLATKNALELELNLRDVECANLKAHDTKQLHVSQETIHCHVEIGKTLEAELAIYKDRLLESNSKLELAEKAISRMAQEIESLKTVDELPEPSCEPAESDLSTLDLVYGVVSLIKQDLRDQDLNYWQPRITQTSIDECGHTIYLYVANLKKNQCWASIFATTEMPAVETCLWLYQIADKKVTRIK